MQRQPTPTGDGTLLAVRGGKPALAGPLPEWPPADEEVRAALDAAFADGSWGRYHGPHCRRLADAIAEMHAVESATLCCSGTMAVELALRGLGVTDQDEVILAAYDFPGNFRAIEAIGARPVLVDIDAETWCLDAAQLDGALSNATKAVIVSHLHGGLADMSKICRWAEAHRVAVLEDACQAPGARVGGRPAGGWGDAAVLSFGGSKLLTAGRGGAVLGRADAAQRIKVFADRGNQAFPLSELQAAVLLPQLARLDERNATRRERATSIVAGAADLPELVPLKNNIDGAAAAHFKLAWRYVGEEPGGAPIDEFVAAAQAEGLPMDTGFRGFARRTARRCCKVGPLANALKAAEQTVLMHHPLLLGPQHLAEDTAAALVKVVHGLRSEP